jgi:hypothetical protein
VVAEQEHERRDGAQQPEGDAAHDGFLGGDRFGAGQ